MMKACLAFLFTLCLAAGAGAQAPCPASEACTGKPKAASPFLEAAAAPAAKKPAPKPAAAPAVVKTAAAPLPQPEAEIPPASPVSPGDGPFSKPLWSLFAAALVAGLYFYLKETPARGKNK